MLQQRLHSTVAALPCSAFENHSASGERAPGLIPIAVCTGGVKDPPEVVIGRNLAQLLAGLQHNTIEDHMLCEWRAWQAVACGLTWAAMHM